MTTQTRTIKLIFFGLVAFALGWFANLFFDNFLFDKKKKENRIIGDSIASQVRQANEALMTNLKHDKKLDSYFNWKTNHADTTNYQCEIEMEDQYLIHWFHGQCAYYFFTYVTSDTTVDMHWSYKTACKLDMDLLEKSHGEKEFPKKGDLFATYTMINDTTLQAKYYFPKWTKKVNDIAKDSLFATYYYMKKKLLVTAPTGHWAVKWLIEALYFVSSSVVAESFRLRNRQLLLAAKR